MTAATFTSRGVKYKTIATGPSRWSEGRVHLAYYVREYRQWVTCCRPNDVGAFTGFHAADTDDLVPVTCHTCLRHDPRIGSVPPTNQPTNQESTMPGFWDDPDIKKAAEGGEYTKFMEIGDSVTGTIKTLSKRDFEGRTAIEVEMDDERKVTFGQVLMLRDLYVLQPGPGDELTVTLAQVQKKGAKTLKMFTGKIVRTNGEVDTFDQTAT